MQSKSFLTPQKLRKFPIVHSESRLDRQKVLHSLRCRARVYRHGEKHVDSQRRKILLFKNKPKKIFIRAGNRFFLEYPVIIYRWVVFFVEETFLPMSGFEPTIYLPNYLTSPDATDYAIDDSRNICI